MIVRSIHFPCNTLLFFSLEKHNIVMSLHPPAFPSHSAINSINPFNWIKVGNRLKKLKPDIIVVRFWIPFMGPAFGTILRRVKKTNIQRSFASRTMSFRMKKDWVTNAFTRYFLKSCDAFITMSEKVMEDLRLFKKQNRPALCNIRSMIISATIIPKEEARKHIGLIHTGPLCYSLALSGNIKDLIFCWMQ